MNKTPLALLSTGILAFGVAACGNDDETSSSTGSSGSSAQSKSDVKPLAEIGSLTGETTAVKLDSGFVEALTSLKVTPGPVGDARITSTGSAVFPITGGNVKYFKPGSITPYVQGLVKHDGSGLSLEAGGTKVKLENFDVDPGKSQLYGDVSVNGKEAAADAPLFFLDGRTLKPLAVKESNGTAVLEGTTVKLTPEAADLLNTTFKIDALKKNLVIGVAKITVALPKSG